MWRLLDGSRQLDNFRVSELGRRGNAGTGPGESPPTRLYTRMDNYEPIFDDIRDLLRQRSTPDLPLVPLFNAIIQGVGTRQQYARFGAEAAKRGRAIIYDTMANYALETKNGTLYWVLTKYRNYDVRRPGFIGPRQPVPEGVEVPSTVEFLGLEAFGLTMAL